MKREKEKQDSKLTGPWMALTVSAQAPNGVNLGSPPNWAELPHVFPEWLTRLTFLLAMCE